MTEIAEIVVRRPLAPRAIVGYTVAISAVAAFCLMLCAVELPAQSEEPSSGKALDLRVQEISDQLRCPTCQAISVRDSEAAFSRQIRDKVRELILAGKDEEEIKAFFVDSYGEWILRAPKKEGVGLLLWLLPLVAIAGVAGCLGFWALRSANTHSTKSSVESIPQLSADETARLDRDLRRFEEDV